MTLPGGGVPVSDVDVEGLASEVVVVVSDVVVVVVLVVVSLVDVVLAVVPVSEVVVVVDVVVLAVVVDVELVVVLDAVVEAVPDVVAEAEVEVEVADEVGAVEGRGLGVDVAVAGGPVVVCVAEERTVTVAEVSWCPSLTVRTTWNDPAPEYVCSMALGRADPVALGDPSPKSSRHVMGSFSGSRAPNEMTTSSGMRPDPGVACRLAVGGRLPEASSAGVTAGPGVSWVAALGWAQPTSVVMDSRTASSVPVRIASFSTRRKKTRVVRGGARLHRSWGLGTPPPSLSLAPGPAGASRPGAASRQSMSSMRPSLSAQRSSRRNPCVSRPVIVITSPWWNLASFSQSLKARSTL